MFSSSLPMLNVPVKAQEPYVKVYVHQPLGYIPGVAVGEQVTIDIFIDVKGVADNSPEGIVGWTMDIAVDPNVLNLSQASAIGAKAGYFLYDFTKRHGYPPPTLLPGIPDPATGNWKDVGEMISAPGGAGEQSSMISPRLVTLVFHSNSATAYSRIDLINVEYIDAMGTWHRVDEVIDGQYSLPAPDLCIEGIVLPYVPMVFQVMYFPAPEPPGLGYRINVTVTNQGTADAGSFQVSFSAYWEEEEVPELVLKETIASLEQGANKTVLFNLVSCENYGNYTLIIMADCNDDVAELDETNNVKMTWVIGTVRGDIDGDGTVDRYDFGLLAMEYGRIFEKPPYHPADFDYNGYVDRYDFGILAMNYGKTV